MRRYRDIREHLEVLEERGLLVRVSQPIDKDTEMHPLVRWQYRGGLPEEQWRAFLFEHVVDCKGRRYDMPVTVGALAGSRAIYAFGFGCSLEEIEGRWDAAMARPIPPVLVESGPVHEEVHTGTDLDREGGGLDELPVPISTPGFDNAPYTTCSQWITKDPDTGIRNVGNYRGQVKARRRLGIFPSGLGQDVHIHWQKCKARGQPLPAALVIGAPPLVCYASVQKVPYGMDELALAGGLAGEPIRVVKCKTVDVEAPAEAEIVIEGLINTEYLEPEGPFGESHGYMHPRQLNPYFEVTAITHRRGAIYVSWISQVTPSESSVIKKTSYEIMFLKHLRDACRIKSVRRVAMHEPLTNLRKLIILQMRHPKEAEVWRALHAAATFHPGVGKLVVAVDDDIDPENLEMVLWAMCYRMKPHKDVHIIGGMEKGHAPPFQYGEEGSDVLAYHSAADDSAMLCNAILKEPFPPISLPKRQYMEKARALWNELGLPPLRPQTPWYGDLPPIPQWDAELEEEAELAVLGEHYKTGEKLAGRRVRTSLPGEGETDPDAPGQGKGRGGVGDGSPRAG